MGFSSWLTYMGVIRSPLNHPSLGAHPPRIGAHLAVIIPLFVPLRSCHLFEPLLISRFPPPQCGHPAVSETCFIRCWTSLFIRFAAMEIQKKLKSDWRYWAIDFDFQSRRADFLVVVFFAFFSCFWAKKWTEYRNRLCYVLLFFVGPQNQKTTAWLNKTKIN